MNHLTDQYGCLEAPQVRKMDTDNSSLGSQSFSQAYVSLKNEEDKVVVYERAGLLFVFNFHPTKSFTDYRVGIDDAGEYGITLSSDEGRYGGFDNIALDSKFFTTPMEWNGRKNWLQVCFWTRRRIITSLISFLFFLGIYPDEDVHCPSKKALIIHSTNGRATQKEFLLSFPPKKKESCAEKRTFGRISRRML